MGSPKLPSRDIREIVFKKVSAESGEFFLKNSAGEKVNVGRAKTEWQCKRNAALRRAEESLKKDPKASGLPVVLEFSLEKDKSRSVKVEGKIAF